MIGDRYGITGESEVVCCNIRARWASKEKAKWTNLNLIPFIPLATNLIFTTLLNRFESFGFKLTNFHEPEPVQEPEALTQIPLVSLCPHCRREFLQISDREKQSQTDSDCCFSWTEQFPPWGHYSILTCCQCVFIWQQLSPKHLEGARIHSDPTLSWAV